MTLGLAATSILALLADLYGVVTMAAFTRFATVPGLVGLALLGAVRVPALAELRKRIRVGGVAGLVGTVGYDLFRIPFVLGGMRLLAPIDSYGLLIAGDSQGSAWSGTLGWLFHLSNGVTFGVMYAVVAARRNQWWGVVWAMVLETATLLTPFRGAYNLNGAVGVIVVAYAAHVFYGLPLGRLVHDIDKVDADMRAVSPRTPALVLLAAVFAVLAWLRPWSESAEHRAATSLARRFGQPVAFVTTDRFTPEWLAVREGGCVAVVNWSNASFTTKHGVVPAHGTGRLCFDDAGVKRVKLGARPYSGGFVYVRP